MQTVIVDSTLIEPLIRVFVQSCNTYFVVKTRPSFVRLGDDQALHALPERAHSTTTAERKNDDHKIIDDAISCMGWRRQTKVQMESFRLAEVSHLIYLLEEALSGWKHQASKMLFEPCWQQVSWNEGESAKPKPAPLGRKPISSHPCIFPSFSQMGRDWGFGANIR